MASNLRVDSIVPATGGSVSIGTATGGVNIPGVLTYEDVTNVDSIGVITARDGLRVTGIATATAFHGDGSALTGVGASFGNSSINTSGIITATAFVSDTPLSNRNLIINGAMNVAQRGVTSTSNLYQTVDRFGISRGGQDNDMTQAQGTVTSGGAYDSGFRRCFKITNANQTGGAGAADFYRIYHFIEAQNAAQSGWNYKSPSSFITLSFWVKSSVAQNFYGYLRTQDGTQQNYPFETGSLTADTWTKVTKTIPGNSNITIDNDNGHGPCLFIDLFDGTDYTGSVTLNQWGAYNGSLRVPDYGSSNDDWYLTNGATFELTGIQLEVGPVATPFEHRSFVDELRRCQRYYYQVGGITNDGGPDEVYGVILPHAMCASSTRVKGVLHHPVNMRDAPSISGGGSGTAKIQVGDSSGNSYLVYNSLWGSSNSTRYTWVDFAPNSGSVSNVGESGIVYANNSTYHLKVSAEL